METEKDLMMINDIERDLGMPEHGNRKGSSED